MQNAAGIPIATTSGRTAALVVEREGGSRVGQSSGGAAGPAWGRSCPCHSSPGSMTAGAAATSGLFSWSTRVAGGTWRIHISDTESPSLLSF